MSECEEWLGGGCRNGGFWHRVSLPFTDSQVLEEVEELRRRGFPISVVGLESGWQDNSYPYTYDWDKIRFPKTRTQ